MRAIAGVTGNTTRGIGNLPDRFTSDKSLFSRRFNCTGGATQVRRVSQGVYEVRFVGNAAQGSVVAGGATIGTVQFANGTFTVTMYRPGEQSPPYDSPFVLFVM